MCNTDSPLELTNEGYRIRYFEWNKHTFEVVSTPCTIDDTKKLISAIVAQAVKDFERLAPITSRKRKADIENWETARGFLFDDGDTELNFAEMLTIVGDGDGFSVYSLRKSLVEKTTNLWALQGVILDDEFYYPNFGSV